MKTNFSVLLVVVYLLTGCGGSDSGSAVSVEAALAQKPTIFGLGISISDIPLTHPDQPQLFVEYGRPTESAEGGGKYIAHPEFYLPLGATVVTAVSDGEVSQIIELDGTEDMLILVKPDDAPAWRIGYEHVSNVMVNRGDRVSTGEMLAELSPQNSRFFAGYGKTSLMVLVDSGGSGDNLNYCPFLLLDDSVRAAIYAEVNAHVQQWEANIGDEQIFAEDQWHSVGCYFEQLNG